MPAIDEAVPVACRGCRSGEREAALPAFSPLDDDLASIAMNQAESGAGHVASTRLTSVGMFLRMVSRPDPTISASTAVLSVSRR